MVKLCVNISANPIECKAERDDGERPDMKWKLRTKIGIGLILVGIGPLICVEYLGHAHNWGPLNVPVLLKPGEFRSPEFKTDLDGRYVVSIAADQLRGRDLWDELCMMGVVLPLLDCGSVKRTLQFDWQIISDRGAVIGAGSYEPAGGTGAEMDFAEFQGHRNSRLSMVLKVHQDAGELNRHHPRLKVEAGGDEENFEGLAFLFFYSLVWGGVFGVLGLLVAILPISWRLKKQRTDEG